MPIVGWVLAMLLGAGWVASEWSPANQPPPAAVEPAWRRTTDGWERLERQPAPLANPGFHPALLAALFVLGSALALGACSERPPRWNARLVILSNRPVTKTAGLRRKKNW